MSWYVDWLKHQGYRTWMQATDIVCFITGAAMAFYYVMHKVATLAENPVLTLTWLLTLTWQTISLCFTPAALVHLVFMIVAWRWHVRRRNTDA